MRRLTNFSTGRLGAELADFLTGHGHAVTLLRGVQATCQPAQQQARVEAFTTTADLRARLQAHARNGVDAVFHAAAVSDFTFGKVWHRSAAGELTEVKSGKISTRQGALLAGCCPPPRSSPNCAGGSPEALLAGWKYEVEGCRSGAIALAERQIRECRTEACVVNGKAYSEGFGLVARRGMRSPAPGGGSCLPRCWRLHPPGAPADESPGSCGGKRRIEPEGSFPRTVPPGLPRFRSCG